MSGLLRTSENESDGSVEYRTLDANRINIENSRRVTDGASNNFSWQVDGGLDQKLNDTGHNISASISVQQSRNKDNSFVEESENG